MRWLIKIGFIALVLALGLITGMWLMRPKIDLPRVNMTQHDVRQAVITRLIDEQQASFLIAGYLEIAAEITEENTKYLFPEYFEDMLSLGTTRSTVRLPGRATYGIDLSRIYPSSVILEADSTIVISVVGLEINSVEPELSNMQVRTEVGWARLSARSGRTVERKAIIFAQEALRKEAEEHLATSPQPLVNAEQAMNQLLKPVLLAAGMNNPVVKVRLIPSVAPPQY